ncbi:MAG: nucleotide sugar dehydrogenase [Phycisphaerales bacterium]
MSHRDRLIQRFASRNARVAVVGLGYVGLPTVRCFHDAGFSVIGFDIDRAKIDALRAGRAYLKHLGEDWVRSLAASPRFRPTDQPADLAEADAVILCVPTPLGAHREPDLTFVERSTEMVAGVIQPGRLVVLTSTSYPGTTREVCLPILQKRGLTLGDDLFLCFSPEREDPGRAGVTTKSIPRLLGGLDPASTAVGLALFAPAVERVIPTDTAEIAEAAKLLENIYRAVNIALVNELKPTLAAMGIDIWKVIDAAATKPYGFQPFYPGPGLGGHCIPIDPFYLTWKAREVQESTRFIELAGEINAHMPARVAEAVARALSDAGKPLRDADVLVIGLAYKPNIDDVRETPALEIISILQDRGAKVSYHDPHVPTYPRMRKYEPQPLRSQPLTRERLAACDCVLIVTNHDGIDYDLIGSAAPLVVDTRNAMARVVSPAARIVKA